MAQVDIPGIGPVDSKWLIGAGAVVVVIVGYSYWRSSGAPAGDVPEPADVDQGAANIPGDTTDSSGSWVPDDDTDPRTEDQWVQVAVERLEAVGYDRQRAAEAIGRWLAGDGLSADQQAMVRTALALMPPLPGREEPPIRPGLPVPSPAPDTPPPVRGGPLVTRPKAPLPAPTPNQPAPRPWRPLVR